MIRCITLILVIVISIYILRCGSSTEGQTIGSYNTDTSTSNLAFKKYSNSTYNFSILHPAEWTIVPTEKGVQFFEINYDDDFAENIAIQAKAVNLNMDDKMMDQLCPILIKTATSEIKKTVPNFKLTASGTMRILGQKACWLEGTAQMPPNVKMKSIFLFNKNKMFVIAYGSVESKFNQYSKIFEKMIDSLEIY